MGRFLDAGNSEFWMSEEYKLASNSEKGLVIPSIRNKNISNRNKETQSCPFYNKFTDIFCNFFFTVYTSYLTDSYIFFILKLESRQKFCSSR